MKADALGPSHLALPDGAGPFPGVVVIHEAFGLNDNIRDNCARFAGEGYAALGPIDDLGSEKVTRLLAAVDLHGAWWDLNAGAGPAWGSPDRAVVKIIVGIHPRS